MKFNILNVAKLKTILLLGVLILGTVLSVVIYAETVEATSSAGGGGGVVVNTPSTVTFDLLKKFSGPVPDGYTADQFVLIVEGDSFGPETVALTGRTDSSADGTIELPVGTYTLIEEGPDGFDPSEWTVQWSGAGCKNQTSLSTTIEVGEGDLGKDNFGCRADNQWRHGILTVEKEVVGTTTDASDFSFVVNHEGNEVFSGSLDNTGVQVAVGEGEYEVIEDSAPNYTTTYSEGCSGTMEHDDRVTCTITNTYTTDHSNPVPGCTDPSANNFNASATTDDGSCTYDPTPVPGCTDLQANNYNPLATTDDGSCDYGGGGGQCVDELQGGWVDESVSNSQGNQKSGSPVLAERSDPNKVIGAKDGEFFSLGFAGSLIMKFDKYVPDVDGDDLSIHEVTNGRDSYPVEKVTVEVSQNSTDWFILSEEATNKKDEGGEGVTLLDFSETGLAWIKYVRVTDTTDASLHDSIADGFDLDAIDAMKELCDEPDDNGDGDDSEPTYKVFGYVWHDNNENDIWDGRNEEQNDEETNEETSVEDDLEGWTVTITDGEQTYSTTTNEIGYYEFYVPAGTWTISETVEDEWQQTFPNEVGVHVVEVIDETEDDSETETAFAPVETLLASLANIFLPAVAMAQTPTTYGEYNFGNVFVGGSDGDDNDNGGGGSSSSGGTAGPRCELNYDVNGNEVTLTWETSFVREVTLTQNGVVILNSTDSDDFDSSTVVTISESTEFVLLAENRSRDRECVVNVLPDAPVGQVLGEQVSVVPFGAPNTGAGGASPLSIPSPSPFVAVMMLRLRNVHTK